MRCNRPPSSTCSLLPRVRPRELSSGPTKSFPPSPRRSPNTESGAGCLPCRPGTDRRRDIRFVSMAAADLSREQPDPRPRAMRMRHEPPGMCRIDISRAVAVHRQCRCPVRHDAEKRWARSSGQPADHVRDALRMLTTENFRVALNSSLLWCSDNRSVSAREKLAITPWLAARRLSASVRL